MDFKSFMDEWNKIKAEQAFFNQSLGVSWDRASSSTVFNLWFSELEQWVEAKLNEDNRQI